MGYFSPEYVHSLIVCFIISSLQQGRVKHNSRNLYEKKMKSHSCLVFVIFRKWEGVGIGGGGGSSFLPVWQDFEVNVA